MAEARGISIAALVRETLDDPTKPAAGLRVSEARISYVAAPERPEEVSAMKRIVISLPEKLHERVRLTRASTGISKAA